MKGWTPLIVNLGHLGRLADDLLDIKSIVSGKLRVKREAVDLRALAADAIEMVRPHIERQQHVVTLDAEANPIVIDADPVRLRQVIANLVENAAKYTPMNGCISVALSTDRDEVAIVVRENGRGIPQEFTQLIFEPFAQLAGDGSASGLGLGLALVKSITNPRWKRHSPERRTRCRKLFHGATAKTRKNVTHQILRRHQAGPVGRRHLHTTRLLN